VGNPRSSPPDGLTHTPEELIARYHKAAGGRPVALLEIDEYSVERIVACARFEDEHTRPGGMVAGPILFTLADTMAYFVTISRSPKGSEAFTTAISMEFLRPAPVGVLLVEGRVCGSDGELASLTPQSTAPDGTSLSPMRL
jgi:uncharacterized protein (TIGR00369 family)